MNTIIGRNLKKLRECNKLTQEQVAKFIGIGRSAYSNYENGQRECPIKLLEKLADLFGCDLALLFNDDDSSTEEMLLCAFRIENLNDADLVEIAYFKNLVRHYLKMKNNISQ